MLVLTEHIFCYRQFSAQLGEMPMACKAAQWVHEGRACHRAKHQQLVQRATAAQAALEEQRRLQQTRAKEARAAEQRYKEMLAHLDPANACAPTCLLPAFPCPTWRTYAQHHACHIGLPWHLPRVLS